MTMPANFLPRRSMGLKLLLVCAMACLMAIPAIIVLVIMAERTERARDVVNEISNLVGGPQTFSGPMLAVPYTVVIPATGDEKSKTERGTYIVSPKIAVAEAELKTGVKKRGPFKAITWDSDLTLNAHFDLTNVGSQAPTGAQLDWSQAEIIVGASDARGAMSDITLSFADKNVLMGPATYLGSVALEEPETEGVRSRVPLPGKLNFFSAFAQGIGPGSQFDATAKLKFAGAQRLAVLAYGDTTTFRARGDWADPSYDGGFLPVKHNASDTPSQRIAAPAGGGFAAEWQVPYIARGVAGEGSLSDMSRLGATSLGVTLVDQKNPHQAVSRSLKYAPLFLGLVFLAYFLFETTQKKRVHPAQYVLIGLAQMIFYLLLLSIAEIIGFDMGFLTAAVATVGLISAYAGWVFKSAKQGYIALVAFTALYSLIYVLMRLEDRALLVGALASFAAIAAVMYFTRNIDWYGGDESKDPPAPAKA